LYHITKNLNAETYRSKFIYISLRSANVNSVMKLKIGKLEGRRPLGKTWYKRQYNIKAGIWCEIVGWI